MPTLSFKERRQHKRYQTKGDLLFSDCGFHVGEIRNVSGGGICCSCINREKIKNASTINLFSSAVNFHLQIPVKTITKKQKPCKILKIMNYNECHLCFDKLNENISSNLDSFIRSSSEQKNQKNFLKNAQEQFEIKDQEGTEELQKAPGKINTLGEILAICSYCRDIRNDEGQYLKLEEYFHKLEVDISHTICPECFEKEMRRLENHPTKKR